MDWGVILEGIKAIGLYVLIAIALWKGLPVLDKWAESAGGIKRIAAEAIVSLIVRRKQTLKDLIADEGKEEIEKLVGDPDIAASIVRLLERLIDKGFAQIEQSPFGGS